MRPPLAVAGLAPVFIAACLMAAEPVVELSVKTDRPQATYAVDEPVTFVVTAKRAGQAADVDVVCTIDADGMPPTVIKPVTLRDGSGTVEGSLGEPGFLRCRVTHGSGAKPAATAMATAAIDPLKIRPSLPVPDDFDAFWQHHKARLAAVPPAPVLEPVKSPPGIECFDAEIGCVPKVLEVARYFDAMNLATRAKGEAVFEVGFLDPHCPPTSVYAAFNNWPGKKRIIDQPREGHRFAPGFADAAIAEHIKGSKVGTTP